jgi:prolyl-tRNA editing enzyme YbaK/EbsC (Cys-tRNA(Pro) deacylase)
MAETDKLLPVVAETLTRCGMVAQVLECPPELADTAAFCEHYHVALEQAANTILVCSHKVEPVRYAVCMVLGNTRLDVNKKVCDLLDVRRASFTDAETTVRLTGMMIGGVVAIGIPDLPIYIDRAVMEQAEVILGGGNRSSKLRLKPQELLKLPNVRVIDDLARPREIF